VSAFFFILIRFQETAIVGQPSSLVINSVVTPWKPVIHTNHDRLEACLTLLSIIQTVPLCIRGPAGCRAIRVASASSI
jgi:hypothetical protein